MRTEIAVMEELGQAQAEMRSLYERVSDTSRSCDIGKARQELSRLARRGASLRRELAELKSGAARSGKAAGPLVTRDALLQAAREKRAIQIGTSTPNVGGINQVRELFREIAESDEILNMASYYYGPNASTNIPVLSPMDEPDGYPEGTSSVTDDSGTGITVTEIQPYAYATVLPVSAEMIAMGAVDIEAELPSIFAKAFARKMHRGMLDGTGTSGDKLMRGLYTSADASAQSTRILGNETGVITITDLAELALTVAAKDASYRIIMNPAVYQNILSSTANDSEDIKIYKEGLIRDKSIEGVPIFLDSLAPQKSSSGGVYEAVAAPLSRYAIGIAGELVIEPIRAPHDTNTYFQAIMFFSGKQVSDKDVYSVTAGA